MSNRRIITPFIPSIDDIHFIRQGDRAKYLSVDEGIYYGLGFLKPSWSPQKLSWWMSISKG